MFAPSSKAKTKIVSGLALSSWYPNVFPDNEKGNILESLPNLCKLKAFDPKTTLLAVKLIVFPVGVGRLSIFTLKLPSSLSCVTSVL